MDLVGVVLSWAKARTRSAGQGQEESVRMGKVGVTSVAELARLATDRRRLGDVDGLLFWPLLGTGRGSGTAPGADLCRSALFAVWRDEGALERFLDTHPIAGRWTCADEAWHVRLRGLGGRGRGHGGRRGRRRGRGRRLRLFAWRLCVRCDT